MIDKKSLQDIHAPKSICFGCGPANKEGLRIRSFNRSTQELSLRLVFKDSLLLLRSTCLEKSEKDCETCAEK